ncbi:Hr-like lesion-inducing protein-like protein [Thalictrum thalictroides]|uniref:Hr-like lesion-inducing protein-like protein n=1 Tax=Thalictrum thalictroides TaxID=46969 RepID=A0A7J6WZV7_THATH|nr:Hr-like lesion-inducing protein-like protein [Thalictrum thalictroides]
MGFQSFLGRLLFASVFILSAWQEFNEYGVDGGPAAKFLGPKYANFTEHLTAYTGVPLPNVNILSLIIAGITLKSLGGFLFIFGSSYGAFLLLLHLAVSTPILYDFYNYDLENPQFGPLFIKFTENVALFGALVFFIEMKKMIQRRLPKKRISKAKAH